MSITNAMNLYLTTCRCVMQADPTDRETWTDLYRYLPYLRQLLSCCVCGKLLLQPIGPRHTVCPHHICKKCVGGTIRFKPACSWCKNHNEFKENKQLKILVSCFKNLCCYINNSAMGEQIAASSSNGEILNLATLLQETVEFDDAYEVNSELPKISLPAEPFVGRKRLNVIPRRKFGKSKYRTKLTSTPIAKGNKVQVSKTETDEKHPLISSNYATNQGASTSQTCSEMHVSCHNIGNTVTPVVIEASNKEITTPDSVGPPTLEFIKNVGPSKPVVKRKSVEDQAPPPLDKYEKDSNDNIKDMSQPVAKRTRHESSSNDSSGRKICKCGRASQPSRLTCLGQRCPCYSSHLPCVGCKCRGCRNPRKGEKSNVSNSTTGTVGHSEITRNKRNVHHCTEIVVA